MIAVTILRVITFFWALPLILLSGLGFIAAIILRQVSFQGLYTNPKVSFAWAYYGFVRRGSWLSGWMQKVYGLRAKGICWGNTIIIRPETLRERPDVVVHELIHAEQALRLSLFFTVFQFIYYRIMRLRHTAKAAYVLNPFEQEAYTRSGESARLQTLRQQYL